MKTWIRLGVLIVLPLLAMACNVGGLSEQEVDSLSATAVAKALTAVPTPTPDIPATIHRRGRSDPGGCTHGDASA